MNGQTQYDAYIGNKPIVINSDNPFMPQEEDDDEDLEEGAIIGIVIGCAALVLIVIIGYVIYKRKTMRQEEARPEDLLINN